MILFARSIGPVKLDAIIRETISSKLTITQNPVEFGADITDHAYIEPKTITVEGVIGGSLSRPLKKGRAEAVAAWQALKALQQSRQLFTYVSGLDVHRNVLIEELTPTRDKDTSYILNFTAVIREVQLVGTAYSSYSEAGPEGGQARNLSKGTLGGDTSLRGSPVAQRGDINQLPVTSTTSQVPSANNGGSILYGLTH